MAIKAKLVKTAVAGGVLLSALGFGAAVANADPGPGGPPPQGQCGPPPGDHQGPPPGAPQGPPPGDPQGPPPGCPPPPGQ
ncbi:hypothetical protein [Nocardia sp. BMG111209]|uniref:hypothetical protein n=1 Tax=Nocardia sp. BMG111209 TaxID=1160137 RepID=UPI000375A428|nr:hypothetical protein [Nocardia sp. BMG111209]